MNKYNNETIYRGNLLKYENGNSRIFEENKILIYDEIHDVFYSYLDVFNFQLSRDLDNLDEEGRSECQKIIDKYSFSYTCSGNEGEVYVDADSIMIETFSQDENIKDKRGNTK